MKRTFNMACLLLLTPIFSTAYAGTKSYSIPETNVKPYGNLYHQHHDFFNSVFSYQGVEAGVMIYKSILLGIYGASFVSNLNASINDRQEYILMAHTGVFVGKIWNEHAWIHPGCQLNAGYFGLKAREDNFSLLDTHPGAIQINGLVLSPQVFGEFNVLKVLKIRTGLSYNFYNYNDHSIVQTSNLQNISFTFGLVFGRFD